MKKIQILGIYVNDRVKEVEKIQSVLTKYGCVIRTRLGIHSQEETYAFDGGLIILELDGDTEECSRLEKELRNIPELEVQGMEFSK